MATVRVRARGDASVDEAWDRYARPARWPEWAPQIIAVRTGAGRIAAGVTGRVVGPLGLTVDFVVDHVDEPARSWRWTVSRFGLRLRLEHAVRTTVRGSATTLAIHGPLPVALGYAPIARVALRRLVRR